jgi:hypothetical protein
MFIRIFWTVVLLGLVGAMIGYGYQVPLEYWRIAQARDSYQEDQLVVTSVQFTARSKRSRDDRNNTDHLIRGYVLSSGEQMTTSHGHINNYGSLPLPSEGDMVPMWYAPGSASTLFVPRFKRTFPVGDIHERFWAASAVYLFFLPFFWFIASKVRRAWKKA